MPARTEITGKKAGPDNSALPEEMPTLPYLVEPSMTINEFCLVERISRATFFKMSRAGLGPEVLRVPGLNVVRVTAEARAAWKARIAAMKDDAVTKTKAEQTAEHATRAAKVSVARRKARRGRRA